MEKELEAPTDSAVDRVYEQLKEMTANYDFKPGERLNELEIARNLGVSRTPLREALNRLNIEGFIRFEPGKGFFCRELDAQEIFDLYELRKSIEVSGIRHAISRAKDEDIQALIDFLGQTGPDAGARTTAELVKLDEVFHERLLMMSNNMEMMRVLRNVNARIRFVRWIDMDRADRPKSQAEHTAVVMHLRDRDEAGCVAILEKHIDRRNDQILSAIKEGYAKIYMRQ